MNKTDLEKYSSAFTLSDMEIFIFPELFYSLVIANIMSPVIWEWNKDNWFKEIEKKSFRYRINRIKQYIMDHYAFNLDLETWGLTDKNTELERFKDIIDISVIEKSNALFGYQGDKYYFSIDIRKHFGLDKYNSNIIPYWKTETVEAMNAFRHIDGYSTGAGECISLSALYAAALFIIGKIPLEKIYLIATPLHSQNFIDEKDGLLTNNRRIVTKKMWYNGTVLSTRSRRALENEKVTIISHISGYIHAVYDKATIDPDYYKKFSISLNKYLSTRLTPQNFINFLRTKLESWKCFQYRNKRNNKYEYIEVETIFKYEHTCKNLFSGPARQALINEIDASEFSPSRQNNKVIINDLEDYLHKNKNLSFEEIQEYFFRELFPSDCSKMKLFFIELKEFLKTTPRLPEPNKQFVKSENIRITLNDTRNDIINRIISRSKNNNNAKLYLHTYRQMDQISWLPFIKAALERNPVSIKGLKVHSSNKIYKIINNLENDSIYDGVRLAQPDEVWNYKRGDGIEKAILLANFLYNSSKNRIEIIISNEDVILLHSEKTYKFKSEKRLTKKIIIHNNSIVEK